MTFTINAWLDKSTPELIVTEEDTGIIVASWVGRACDQLFQTGVVSLQELNQASKAGIKKLVKRLLLEYASEQMCITGIKDCRI